MVKKMKMMVGKLTDKWEVIQWPSFSFPMPVTSLEVKIDKIGLFFKNICNWNSFTLRLVTNAIVVTAVKIIKGVLASTDALEVID